MDAITPRVDHHIHLLSPAASRHGVTPPLPAIELPQDLGRLIRKREKAWNDSSVLANIFTEDTIALSAGDAITPSWIRGRAGVASFIAQQFARPYRITPVAFRVAGSHAHMAGYYTRGTRASLKHFGHVFLALRRGSNGRWKIASEMSGFPGPAHRNPIGADRLVAQLDAAGIEGGVVLSLAYWFGSPLFRALEDEHLKVRAENDWTAQQVARFPKRLVAFCSFNPLKDYALRELDRCAMNPLFRGLKLHFGNSSVDVRNPLHAAKVRRIFRAANDHGLAIVVHLWTDPTFEEEGAQHARAFLNRILPEVPDVPVQIAHMAGGGRSTDSALAVFVDAIAANDPRIRNLYFDVATLVAGESEDGLRRNAMRFRQVGVHRILYGTDLAPPSPPARQSWVAFRIMMPLTDDEFKVIAANVAPYMRSRS